MIKDNKFIHKTNENYKTKLMARKFYKINKILLCYGIFWGGFLWTLYYGIDFQRKHIFPFS